MPFCDDVRDREPVTPTTGQRNPDEVGALWLRESKGKQYLSGTVNGVRVVVFKNEHKQKDTQPDYRVLRARDPGERP